MACCHTISQSHKDIYVAFILIPSTEEKLNLGMYKYIYHWLSIVMLGERGDWATFLAIIPNNGSTVRLLLGRQALTGPLGNHRVVSPSLGPQTVTGLCSHHWLPGLIWL